MMGYEMASSPNESRGDRLETASMSRQRSSDFPSLVDPEFVARPYPILARLREEDPVHWDEGLGTWFITRHDDVHALFADPRLSTNRRLARDHRPATGDGWLARFEALSVLNADPATHRQWRKLVSAGFTPRAVRRMDAQVREVVEDFAAPLRGRKGRIDLLAEFADPIPNTVIGRITGIPPYPGEEARFRSLGQAMMRRYTIFADAETVARGGQAIEELGEWVEKLAEERRQAPREDLVSDLIHGGDPAERPTNERVVVLIASLVSAGSETTTLGACQLIRHLLEHPAELARLRADRGLVPSAVREALRFEFGSLAGVNPRYALEDVVVRDKTIRRGEMVMLSPAAANRDPRVFPEPDRFDIGRDTREAVTFGHGPHYCLGANLAMQELSSMLEALLDLLPPSARLVSNDADWEQVGIMRRPLRLVVDVA